MTGMGKKAWSMGLTVVCTFHENITRISMHGMVFVRIRQALVDSHTHTQYVVAHASLFELGRMPSNQRKIQASTRCKRCLWNANTLLNLDFIWEKWLRQMNKYIIGWWHVRANTNGFEVVCMECLCFIHGCHYRMIESERERETHREMEHKLGDDEKWS